MSLSQDVNAELLLAKLQKHTPHKAVKYRATTHSVEDQATQQLAEYMVEPAPKFRLQEDSIDKDVAYKIIEGELDLDGKPALNLASFVNTDLDANALKLCLDNLTKNLADSDEYPALMMIHQRCVAMLSDLWNVPKGKIGVGTATTGSSEAIHLGGLAMKRRWESKARAKGRDISGVKPNIVMGANAQVALEKFARYFDVQARVLDVDKESDYGFNVSKLKENVDENTIGVFVILGSTYTGHYHDVQAISDILDDYERETGHDIPIHIDGASGAMVAPFCTPNLVWDFRLRRVKSINTSGHKFGLTTAGCGWIIWREKKYLPEELLFILHYLGGAEETYTLNFSRPGFPVIHQYYNFISMGMSGYRKAHGVSLANARLLSTFLEATGYFTVESDIHRKRGVKSLVGGSIENSDHEHYNPGLPVVAFRFSDDFNKKYPMVPQQALSTLLRVRGYIIPNYALPPSCSDIEVLRVVVRHSMAVDFLDKLMEDIVKVVQRLIMAVEAHAKEGAGVQKIYDTLLTITASNSEELEHPLDWDIHEDMDEPSGTRNRHMSIC
jgi:glutamate decarboxylase